jgi:hypothetical protein
MIAHQPPHGGVQGFEDVELLRHHPEGFDDDVGGAVLGDQAIDVVVVDRLLEHCVDAVLGQRVHKKAHAVEQARRHRAAVVGITPRLLAALEDEEKARDHRRISPFACGAR